MAEIYALSAAGNCGKTTTLKKVFKLLKDKYPKYQMIEGDEDADLTEEGVDVQVIFEITVNNKKLKIGIETEGDVGNTLEENLDYLISKECDIIFCACRTKGGTSDAVWKYKKKHRVWTLPRGVYCANYDKEEVNRKEALALIARAEI